MMEFMLNAVHEDTPDEGERSVYYRAMPNVVDATAISLHVDGDERGYGVQAWDGGWQQVGFFDTATSPEEAALIAARVLRGSPFPM